MDMDGQEDRSRENTLNDGSQHQQQSGGSQGLNFEERLRFAQMAQHFFLENLIRQGQQQGAGNSENQGQIRQPTLWIQRDGQLYPLALQLLPNFNPNQIFGRYHNIEQQMNNWESLNSTLSSHEVGSVEDGKECAICYEAYEKKSDALPHHKLFTLPCGHTFHSTCLRFAVKNTGNKCPYCRQLIQKKITSPKSSLELQGMDQSSSLSSISVQSNQQIIIQQQLQEN